MMHRILPRIATRAGIAVLAVLLAGGTAFAATAMHFSPARSDRPATTERAAEASEAPEPSESAEPSESPEAAESAEPSESPEASEAPEPSEEPGAAPSAANVERIIARLAAAGITTTPDEFTALAAKVGVGGAVRVLSLANASGKTPAEILAMFEGGMGWGQVARELGQNVGPGIGWIMGKGHAAQAGEREGKGAKQGHGKK